MLKMAIVSQHDIALLTLECLLASVNPLVTTQRKASAERFVADRAYERLVSRVGAQMRLE